MTPEERTRWLETADRHDRECGFMQACCEMATSEATKAIRELVAAIAEEREACAGLIEMRCELLAIDDTDAAVLFKKMKNAVRLDDAAAIRART